MKILVYRRTHTGDPDPVTQTFGINDCMGSVRDWSYDAVIGIGGVAPDPGDENIRMRITWIGISPMRREATQSDVDRMKISNSYFSKFRGKLINFRKFILLNDSGPLVANYPDLHEYMFVEGRIPRAAMTFPSNIEYELMAILKLAQDANESGTGNLNLTENSILLAQNMRNNFQQSVNNCKSCL